MKSQGPKTAQPQANPEPTSDLVEQADGLIEQLARLQPRLQRMLALSMPEDLRNELGSITIRQLGSLAYLPDGGATMRNFADALGITGAAATALADRMISHGLAERHYQPEDRRTVRLAPTERAKDLLKQYRTWQQDAMAGVLAKLSEHELATFLAVLNALESHLEQ